MTNRSADRKIGMLLNELERQGILDKTMIILLADHGEIMDEGESKQFGHGTLDYGGLRVPLIMHYPGVVPARIEEHCAAQCVDILPTVTRLLNLDDPAHRQGIFLFAGSAGSASGADSLDADLLAQERPAFASGDILVHDDYTVITPRWQYTIGGDRVSLHRTEDDPYLAPDVIGAYPAVAESLRHVLAAWMDRCIAEAVVPFSAEGRSAEPGQEVRQRLKALGYVQ